MRWRHAASAVSLLWPLLVTTSCGPGAQEGGGIGGTGIVAGVSSGPVTGFGSVFVSGDEYDTASTFFTVDRIAGATQDQLKKGMIVLVEATLLENTDTKEILERTADRITYSDSIEGPVQQIDAAGKMLTVLGQTVLVTDATIIDEAVPGRNLTQLRPNVDVLEISGFVVGDGALVATLIDRKNGPPDYELKGFVKNHDAGAETFEIGNVTIDYAGADISMMPPPGGNAWNALSVHLLGNTFLADPSGEGGGRLHVSSVGQDSIGVQESTRAEIEGFVTRVVDSSSFLVGQVRVQFDTHTVFEGGVSADISPGVRVEVDGVLTGEVLEAQRIELNNGVKLESNISVITSSDGISGTLLLAGLFGTIIHVNSHTQVHGVGDVTSLNQLAAGDHVTVRGESFGSEVLATEITRQSPSGNRALQGPTVSSSDPLLTILGTTIDTSALPDSAFRRVDDAPIGRATFFASVSPGVIVEVEGLESGDTIRWLEAELQQ